MIELSKAQYKSLNPVFQGEIAKTVESAFKDKHPSEMVFGSAAGRVLVDDIYNPNVTLVINGDLHISGNSECDESDNDLYNLVLNNISQDNEWHLLNVYSSDDLAVFC